MGGWDKIFSMSSTFLRSKRVLVGLSGGVDSSLSVALLKEQGYEVTAGFIKNWSDTKDLWTGECAWRAERRDALRVCALLGIDLLTFDFEKDYRERVLQRMFDEYEQGITPNPDVLCNEEIKFGLFAQAAFERGFDVVATGHYARVIQDEQGQAHLLKAIDEEKDQSYFLHRVSQDVLRRTLFPIGHLKKSEVRLEAERRGLPTASKPDSQGICFVGKINFHEFLRKKIPSVPGDIVTYDGRIVGRHDGLDAYTIGQRQGIRVSQDQRAWYVAEKHLEKNELIVVPDRDDPRMFRRQAEVHHVHWINQPLFPVDGQPVQLEVVTRYHQIPTFAQVNHLADDVVRVVFDQPVWAVAPGQSAVFFDGQECLGGGFLN